MDAMLQWVGDARLRWALAGQATKFRAGGRFFFPLAVDDTFVGRGGFAENVRIF
jgi:hypothetical protein